MDINKIKDEDIVYSMERIEPPFASSVAITGMVNRENMKRYFECDSMAGWIHFNYYFFNIKKEVADLQQELKDKMIRGGTQYILKVTDTCNDVGSKMLQVCREVMKDAEKQKLSKNEMAELLNKYWVAITNYTTFYNILFFDKPAAELAMDIAKKHSNNEDEANHLFNLMTTPIKVTDTEHERDDFLRICINPAGDKSKLAEEHAKKYGWLAIRYFIGEPWTKEEVLDRIEKMDIKKAKIELDERIRHREERDKEIEEAMTNFNKNEKEIVKQARTIVYLRTQRGDYYQEASYYVQPLVKKIAKELGVSYADLVYLTLPEVLLTLKGKFDYLDHIKKRKRNFIIIYGDGVAVLEGKEVEEYVKDKPILRREIKNIREFKGNIGYKGKITGKARILSLPEHMKKVQKGDILVMIMTTPNFNPAMEKASAFVTDEGGITCHAAIIAREMRKPCVIATKIATKVIKDGDLIEVDADKGIVKIIERAK